MTVLDYVRLGWMGLFGLEWVGLGLVRLNWTELSWVELD